MKWLLPPVLVALLLIAMVMVAVLAPAPAILPPPFHFFGVLVLLAGVGLIFAGSLAIRAAGTEINTFRRPRSLVTNSVFAYSRNPIYLGFAVLLLGAAILLNAVATLVFVALFFLVANAWYIPFEEKAAEEVFGDAYRAYRDRVRRWI